MAAKIKSSMLFINKKFSDRVAIIAALLVLVFQFGFPNSSYVALAELQEDHSLNYPNTFPQSQEKQLKLVRTVTIPVTAYNSEPGQTDSTPCITANGFDLCENNEENVIATNMLPFGTKVKFPDYDPDTVFTVQDRMNARYYHKADIWMKEKSDAIKFGHRTLTMEIYQ